MKTLEDHCAQAVGMFSHHYPIYLVKEMLTREVLPLLLNYLSAKEMIRLAEVFKDNNIGVEQTWRRHRCRRWPPFQRSCSKSTLHPQTQAQMYLNKHFTEILRQVTVDKHINLHVKHKMETVLCKQQICPYLCVPEVTDTKTDTLSMEDEALQELHETSGSVSHLSVIASQFQFLLSLPEVMNAMRHNVEVLEVDLLAQHHFQQVLPFLREMVCHKDSTVKMLMLCARANVEEYRIMELFNFVTDTNGLLLNSTSSLLSGPIHSDVHLKPVTSSPLISHDLSEQSDAEDNMSDSAVPVVDLFDAALTLPVSSAVTHTTPSSICNLDRPVLIYRSTVPGLLDHLSGLSLHDLDLSLESMVLILDHWKHPTSLHISHIMFQKIYIDTTSVQHLQEQVFAHVDSLLRSSQLQELVLLLTDLLGQRALSLVVSALSHRQSKEPMKHFHLVYNKNIAFSNPEDDLGENQALIESFDLNLLGQQIDFTALPSEDVVRQILSRGCALRKLLIKGVPSTGHYLHSIFENKHLESVYLHGINIPPSFSMQQKFPHWISIATNLRVLKLQRMTMKPVVEDPQFPELILNHPTLQELDLSENSLGVAGCRLLQTVCERCHRSRLLPGLKVLDIGWNGIELADLLEAAAAVRLLMDGSEDRIYNPHRPSYYYLSLSGNVLRMKGQLVAKEFRSWFQEVDALVTETSYPHAEHAAVM